jgi:hypothetical protein
VVVGSSFRPKNQTMGMSSREIPCPAAVEYNQRIRERRRTQKGYRRRVLWIRLAACSMLILFLFSLGMLWRQQIHPWPILLPLGLFLVLLKYGDHLSNSERETATAASFYEQGLDRIAGQWIGRGNTQSFVSEGHLYAYDLDLFGKGSLFDLLCTARTEIGTATLAEWLCASAPSSEIIERQAAVRELQVMTDLRETLAVLRPKTQRRSMKLSPAEWMREAPPAEAHIGRWVAPILASLVVAVGFLWLVVGYDLWPLLIAILAGEIAFSLFYYNRRHAVLDSVDDLREEFRVLRRTFAELESQNFLCPKLLHLQRVLLDDKGSASTRLAVLIRVVDRLEIAKAAWPITGPLLLGTQLVFVAERWKRINQEIFGRWMNTLGELEALCSLATFAFEHPETSFPEVTAGKGLLDARDVRHPLLQASTCVPNTVKLDTNTRLLIVSGSNMSGKSTLLRTVGVNVVLAQAGSTVCASQMRLSSLAMGASIRLQDSLLQRKSRFYAEITRLKAIADLADEKDRSVLFLIDEMLSGTNYYDRAVGSEAVLRHLIDADAIGIVTTHDLTLTKLSNSADLCAMNVHFQDELVNDQIIFDHVFHLGVVERSNALDLMRTIGLQIPSRDIQ